MPTQRRPEFSGSPDEFFRFSLIALAARYNAMPDAPPKTPASMLDRIAEDERFTRQSIQAGLQVLVMTLGPVAAVRCARPILQESIEFSQEEGGNPGSPALLLSAVDVAWQRASADGGPALSDGVSVVDPRYLGLLARSPLPDGLHVPSSLVRNVCAAALTMKPALEDPAFQEARQAAAEDPIATPGAI